MTLCRSNKPKAVQHLGALNRIVLVFCLLGFLLPTWCGAYTPAKVLFPFQGKIDFLQKHFSLWVDLGNKDSVSLEIVQNPANANQSDLSVDIKHLRTPIFDISSVLQCPLEVVKDAAGRFQGLNGKVWSKYTLINYQPVHELFGNFQLRDKTLDIGSLVVGNLVAKGTIHFGQPYAVNLTLNLTEIDVSDVLSFWLKENTGIASGRLSGKITLNGPLNRLQVRGSFVAYNGMIKDSAFENLAINFEGIYPVMTLFNSTGAKPNGFTFNIDGNVDLSDRANFIPQIRALSKQAIVQKQGENLEWTLKRIKSDQHSDTTTELKYLKRQDSNEIGISSKEEDMIGVQRSIHF